MQIRWKLYPSGGIDAAPEPSVGSLRTMVIPKALKKYYSIDALVLSQLLMGAERQSMMDGYANSAEIVPFRGY